MTKLMLHLTEILVPFDYRKPYVKWSALVVLIRSLLAVEALSIGLLVATSPPSGVQGQVKPFQYRPTFPLRLLLLLLLQCGVSIRAWQT